MRTSELSPRNYHWRGVVYDRGKRIEGYVGERRPASGPGTDAMLAGRRRPVSADAAKLSSSRKAFCRYGGARRRRSGQGRNAIRQDDDLENMTGRVRAARESARPDLPLELFQRVHPSCFPGARANLRCWRPPFAQPGQRLACVLGVPARVNLHPVATAASPPSAKPLVPRARRWVGSTAAGKNLV